ncbi:hypothetical protein DENIS_3848 [Desulfonema ishimotonii]|uniref:Uncharacterized protein n=1 Tax=Desulfonema ishimotonii TaxID=45657 RepID=A0A401G0W5_9BACT|nr:hypothetical protein [Desulfonema ishimotonii]GBC62864.1 hypothetical protein DENIS_3848 [Desulfonema ishimotonii]
MKEKVIKTLHLENGLDLILCDASRKIIGDRWLVKFTAKIEVPTDQLRRDMADRVTVDPAVVSEGLGPNVIFEQQRERNFIDDINKAAVFKELHDSFLDSTFAYLSHPDFPSKFILKKFREYSQQKGMGLPAV